MRESETREKETRGRSERERRDRERGEKRESYGYFNAVSCEIDAISMQERAARERVVGDERERGER